jgi:hypothetical protein
MNMKSVSAIDPGLSLFARISNVKILRKFLKKNMLQMKSYLLSVKLANYLVKAQTGALGAYQDAEVAPVGHEERQ